MVVPWRNAAELLKAAPVSCATSSSDVAFIPMPPSHMEEVKVWPGHVAQPLATDTSIFGHYGSMMSSSMLGSRNSVASGRVQSTWRPLGLPNRVASLRRLPKCYAKKKEAQRKNSEASMSGLLAEAKLRENAGEEDGLYSAASQPGSNLHPRLGPVRLVEVPGERAGPWGRPMQAGCPHGTTRHGTEASPMFLPLQTVGGALWQLGQWQQGRLWSSQSLLCCSRQAQV